MAVIHTARMSEVRILLKDEASIRSEFVLRASNISVGKMPGPEDGIRVEVNVDFDHFMGLIYPEKRAPEKPKDTGRVLRDAIASEPWMSMLALADYEEENGRSGVGWRTMGELRKYPAMTPDMYWSWALFDARTAQTNTSMTHRLPWSIFKSRMVSTDYVATIDRVSHGDHVITPAGIMFRSPGEALAAAAVAWDEYIAALTTRPQFVEGDRGKTVRINQIAARRYADSPSAENRRTYNNGRGRIEQVGAVKCLDSMNEISYIRVHLPGEYPPYDTLVIPEFMWDKVYLEEEPPTSGAA